MSNPNLQKHTLSLRRGDWDYIESVAAPHGIATSQVIRTLVANWVDAKRSEEPAPDTADFPEEL